MGCIYKITNTVNDHIYIGQTVKTAEERWKQHVRCALKDYTKYSKIDRAIRKYGAENFVVEVIEECSEEMLDEREIYWIDYYKSFNTPYGYNLTSG